MTLIEGSCEICSKKFLTKSNYPSAFCSASCRTKAWRIKYPEKQRAHVKASAKRAVARRNGKTLEEWKQHLKSLAEQEKSCPSCQKIFKSAVFGKVYCCQSCANMESKKRWKERGGKPKAYAWTPKEIKCRLCGNEFKMSNPRHRPRYCSLDCLRLSKAKRRREKIKRLCIPGNHHWMARKFRNVIRLAIKRQAKHHLKLRSTARLLGCTFDELKNYLESQFKPGMSWSTYGYRGWHIDHKRPCDSFDLSKAEEQEKCFHYTNLQPLWWKDNLRKQAKWDGQTCMTLKLTS